MASEKNSRLINLVIALLATKKFLTKPQIFKAVEGYEGNQEAVDRMFERDKEELRALGIEIEMKSIDPLFDDEIGYRIRPERYRLDLGSLTNEEVGILALAAQAWRDSAFADIALSTARRLESLGIAADFSDIPIESNLRNAPNILIALLDAIEDKRVVEFDYLNKEDIPESRRLAPHGIYTKGQHWYLVAVDLTNESVKNFRLDRIEGDVKTTKKAFVPKKIDTPKFDFPKLNAILEIRRDSAQAILSRAKILDESDDWLKVEIDFDSEEIALSEILRQTPDIKVLQPEALKVRIVDSLNTLMSLHEH